MADPRIERAADAGVLSKQALDDLGAVFGDFDTSLGGVSDLGEVAHTHAPTLLAKLEHMLEQGGRHGYGHIGTASSRLSSHIDAMIARFASVVRRNIHLERELAIMNQSSNVVLSTPIDNLNALTNSTVVTFGAPYSGVDFMICAALLPAELTPAGRFSTLNFMGIDFASNSINAANVQYAVNTPGTLGQPLQQGMGLSSFYTNLTAPKGPRTFEPWVGWYFDASAKITFSIYNPSTSAPATYLLDWLMRASPCPQVAGFTPSMVQGHIGYHAGMDDVFDAIHHFAMGVSPKMTHHHPFAPTRQTQAALRNGMAMLAGPHGSSYGNSAR
jgi:hypothetical protein